MKNQKLQSLKLYITEEDLEDALRQIYPDKFEDMPIKLTGVEFDKGNNVKFEYTVLPDESAQEELWDGALRIFIMV